MEYYILVRFENNLKNYYFSCDKNSDYKIGDLVVVETVNGEEIGFINSPLRSIQKLNSKLELKPILRKANKDDLESYEILKENAKIALRITKREVEKLKLNMSLLNASYTLDGTKILITYTSDNRVDFRDLLKTLAPQLHCRIELRQLASRDKAKIIGGLGICGLPLCCKTFLNEFDGVSIALAKNQMLTLNIPKLSGMCGKLMCCLEFEDEAYSYEKQKYPSLNSKIIYQKKEYNVSAINIISKKIKLVDEESNSLEISLDEYNLSRTYKNK